MFCNKATQECRDFQCKHAGRHRLIDGCFSNDCAARGLNASCVSSTLSDQFACPEDEIKHKQKLLKEFARQEDIINEQLRRINDIADSIIETLGDIKEIENGSDSEE